jgi:hypothetical protein
MPEFWIFLAIADYDPESGTGRNPGMVQRQKTAVFWDWGRSVCRWGDWRTKKQTW